MTLSLFDQFLAPQLLGLSLMTIALAAPLMVLTAPARPITNRLAALQTNAITLITKQLMTPLNPRGHTWSLPITTVMAYLLIINLIGLIPYTFTPTTQLALNMALAVPLWLMTVLLGLRTQPTNSLAHMLPLGTPTPLVPALILIETVSLFIRPLALGVRLTANLTAGHLLMTLVSSTTLALLTMMPTLATLTATLLLLLTGLEIAVAVIQAYVFTLLLSLYLQDNT
uniref:ATP synthase F0 subunit 6 n=1 Tax=Hemidactylus mandebensis TaxID=1643449 RepID=UPI0021B5F62B|nr:ATP synthase F0 subunit 6 [Hemidactylus mandebensis]UVW80917.1 ATP synthase F0 subunit 6 [Hemidactylus mandebensis]